MLLPVALRSVERRERRQPFQLVIDRQRHRSRRRSAALPLDLADRRLDRDDSAFDAGDAVPLPDLVMHSVGRSSSAELRLDLNLCSPTRGGRLDPPCGWERPSAAPRAQRIRHGGQEEGSSRRIGADDRTQRAGHDPSGLVRLEGDRRIRIVRLELHREPAADGVRAGRHREDDRQPRRAPGLSANAEPVEKTAERFLRARSSRSRDLGCQARGDLEQRGREVACRRADPTPASTRARARSARRAGRLRRRGSNGRLQPVHPRLPCDVPRRPRGSRTERRDCRSDWSGGRDTRARPAACPRRRCFGSTVTPSTSMRASQLRSASSTVDRIRVSVVLSTTSNTSSWMPQPKFGRITRSPGAVSRMIRIDWRMSCLVRRRSRRGRCADRARTGSPSRGRARPSARRMRGLIRSSPSARRARSRSARPASTTMSPCRAAGSPPIMTVDAAHGDDAADMRLHAVDQRTRVGVASRHATPAVRQSARSGSPVPAPSGVP